MKHNLRSGLSFLVMILLIAFCGASLAWGQEPNVTATTPAVQPATVVAAHPAGFSAQPNTLPASDTGPPMAAVLYILVLVVGTLVIMGGAVLFHYSAQDR